MDNLRKCMEMTQNRKSAAKIKIGKLPLGWLEQDAQRVSIHNDGNVEDKDTIRVQKDFNMLCYTTILRMRQRERDPHGLLRMV